MRPGWQAKPRPSNSAPRPRPAEFTRFPQRRLAPWLWRALAQVLLRIFRPAFLTRRRTAAPRSWPSRQGSSPPSRYQKMAPASSTVSLLSTTPRLARRMRFTVELTPSRPIVAWRSLRLVPHKRLSDATYWIACTRWGQHALRERNCAPRFWGGSGESAPLQTSISIRLSVQFFPADEPTCSLVVWACVVPALVMQHEVLLGRDSWMRFNNRTYRFVPPRAMDHRMFGEIELSHHAPAGLRA